MPSPPSVPPDLTRADSARLRHHQDRLLTSMLERLSRQHPYYKGTLAELDRLPASVVELPLLPLTRKEDFAAQPEQFASVPVDGDDEDVLWDVVYTSGSTGRPAPIYQTARDFRGILMAQRRMAQIRGITTQDRIANLYPLTQLPHGAWLRANNAAAALGVPLLTGLGGTEQTDFNSVRPTAEIIPIVAAFEATVLWGVPTYLRRFLREAHMDGQLLPSVRMLTVSGEPCPPALTSELKELCAVLGAENVSVSNSFGASEMQCGLVECHSGAGFHNPAPELFYFEAVDEAGAQVADGEPGLLTLTHLDRRGTAMLRYVLGDLVTFTYEACPACGRRGGRITEHLGRSGSYVKIRGNLVDARTLDDVITRFPGVVDYAAVVDIDPISGMDTLTICVTGLDGECAPQQLSDAVAKAIRVTPSVQPVAPAQLHRQSDAFKPKRLRDVRSEL